MGQMNPSVVLEGANPTSINAGRYLGDTHASNMESTPSVNAFPSSTSTEGHVGGSSALYVVTPVEDFNSSTSIRMPQTSTSSIGNTSWTGNQQVSQAPGQAERVEKLLILVIGILHRCTLEKKNLHKLEVQQKVHSNDPYRFNA